MSNMLRHIRRGIAKKRGTFVSKDYRTKEQRMNPFFTRGRGYRDTRTVLAIHADIYAKSCKEAKVLPNPINKVSSALATAIMGGIK